MFIALFAASLVAQAPGIPAASQGGDAPAVAVELAPLPLDQQTALRCSAAIAIATERQRAGKETPADWPNLLENERGREFFVRSLAKVMDETGLTRDGIAAHGRKEAKELLGEPGRLEEIMPACLALLELSGL